MINVHYITGVALFYTTLSSEFVMLFRFLLLFEPFLMIGKHLHRVVIGTSEFRETFRIDAALVLDENIGAIAHQPPGGVHVVTSNGFMQRCLAVCVLRVHIRAGVQQKLHYRK